MKKEVADLWVKALRSGDYQQGTGALCRDNKYCCLGVLSAITPGIKIKNLGPYKEFGISRATGLLASEVREYSGVGSDVGIFSGDQLAKINDAGATFAEIADIIEQKWKEL